MVKRSFVSLWFITSQRKMQLDENRNCVVIIMTFLSLISQIVLSILGVFVFAHFFFSSSSEIFPPLGNRSRDNSDHLRILEINQDSSCFSVSLIVSCHSLLTNCLDQPSFIIIGSYFVTLIFIDKMMMHCGWFFLGVKCLPKQTIPSKSYIQTQVCLFLHMVCTALLQILFVKEVITQVKEQKIN